MEELVLLFRGLGDESRLRLLGELVRGPRYVDELSHALSAPQPKVSRHLAYLRRCGLVRAERKGRHVFYHLTRPDGSSPQAIFQLVCGSIGNSRAARKSKRRR
jgi:ArsR family transcriptional regulator